MSMIPPYKNIIIFWRRRMLKMKSCFQLFVLGATIVVCVVNLTSFTYKISKQVRSHQQQPHSFLPYCFANASMGLVDEGVWEPLSGSTERDYQMGRELDKFIRVSMGWAPILHLSNLRCGRDATIPGYRLLAQCKPDSQHPCCNLNTGFCGNGPKNCKCENCTDFREMVSAELAKWRPKQCTLKDYTWKDSCSLLDKNDISLHFIGDSLIRHVHTAMLLHLTDDQETGAIPQNASEEVRQKCSGVLQITKKECSVEHMAQRVEELKNHSVCTGFTTRKFQIDLVQDYHRTLIQEVKDKFKSLLNRKNAWIIGGVGLHYQLDFEMLKREYLEKIVGILQESNNGWPKVLWVENHAYSGYIRQVSGPNMKSIKRFNKVIEEYLDKHDIKMLRTFELTKNVRSYDGRHHGLALNQLKVKLVLNYLDQVYKHNST